MADLRITPIILQLAKRARGFSVEDAYKTPGHVANAHQVSQQVSKLVRGGRLFKAKLGHRTVRYFDDQTRADQQAVAYAKVKKGMEGMFNSDNRHAARWADDTPADDSRAKITVCPPYTGDPRIQVPDSFVGDFTREWQQLRGAR